MNHGEMADKILESDLPVMQKVILLGYLKHRNKKTGLSWPGASTLAKYASTSRQVVMRHRAQLIEKGWIKVVKHPPGKPMVVSFRHHSGASAAPPVVPLLHPNLLKQPSLKTLKEITDMSEQESWDEWNALRKELDPKYRSNWKLKTWRKHWVRCLKVASAEEILEAFRYFWKSQDTQWWRENRPSPSQSFLNGSSKHLSGWVQSAKDAVVTETKEQDNRENTSSLALARLWVRRNRPQLEMAMRRGSLEEELALQVTDVDAVLRLLGRLSAAGGE